MTPLLARILERIAASGPISVEDYMALCLADPVHGYYMTRDPIGVDGDFTTAPEISQMFGEMVGVWLLQAWQSIGAPNAVALVELGPGRGTLMADILRTAKIVPAFHAAITVHLVETSPVLRARQTSKLRADASRLRWHNRLSEVPRQPALIVANEFFDALPIRQWQRRDGQWRERIVGCAHGRLHYALHHEPDLRLTDAASEGAIREVCAAGETVMAEIAARLVSDGGSALVIDYGHSDSGFGDTLQAVRRHAFADVFAEPGEADLTGHVDFARLRTIAQHMGASSFGPVTQGDFLRAMGIEARAEKLSARANDVQRADIAMALQRLTAADRDSMGVLFKVMALAQPNVTS
ncbi:MAG: class I SAM-dependent methyltransferase, partial [Beijerinckiaceae bacterium]